MTQALLFDSVVDAGEILLTAGAEINRVEDTIQRMAYAYDFARIDVLTITSSIMITAYTMDGQTLTQIRRIKSRSINMRRIEAVNTLSRQVCAQQISACELQARIQEIRDETDNSLRIKLLCYLLIAFSFAVFFGGSFRDGLAGMLCSVVLLAMDELGERIKLQPIVVTILESAAMCFAALATVWLGIGLNADKIIIGNIMLIIPGIALITALRDMIIGDTISGILGVCEAILRALAIAVGCALILMKFGGVIG